MERFRRKMSKLVIFLGLVFLLTPRSIESKEVNLLDTTKDTKLNWVTYSKAGGAQGWAEGTHNNPNSEPLRTYVVCQVTKSNVDNWLRLPYIKRGNAHTLYIEIKFTIRRCNKHGNPSQIVNCRETFNLYYFEAESDLATNTTPSWNSDMYTKIGKVAAEHMWDSQNKKVTINKVIKSKSVKRKGVYFAIQDTGACIMIRSIRVYYKTCPEVIKNYAIYEETDTKDTIVTKEGVCVNNAQVEKKPTQLCQSNGNWHFTNTGCVCMPGYEPSTDRRSCSACSVGTYKWRAGNHFCLQCPRHSSANQKRMVDCKCDSGYYRNRHEDKSKPCTRPPSAPQNLVIESLKDDIVQLRWQRPRDLGGRNDLWYVVDSQWCTSKDKCHSVDREIRYYPSRTLLNVTRVTITNLESSSRYKVTVSSYNGVSEISQSSSPAHIMISTKKFKDSKSDKTFNPKSEVFNVKAISDTSITLAWSDIHGISPKNMYLYEVYYFPKHFRKNYTTVITNKTQYTFKNLNQDTEYGFMIRGRRTRHGWSNFTNPIYVRSGKGQSSNISVGIIAGSIVSVILCMVIAIIMVYILFRRNRNGCGDKDVSDCVNLHFPTAHEPLFRPPGSLKMYVDPHTYEDPADAVRQFTREIDASFINIETIIGEGEFGEVCRGILSLPDRPSKKVAIKTLKPGATDKNRSEFLTEATIMGQFDNQNVICLEGVVTKSNPVMIITEYMDNGSLDAFLRTNDGKFTVMQLVGMMHGVALGMKYLADMGYVHRDLAARNILVNVSLVCKVSDFGLSREITHSSSSDAAYTTKGGKIPVRWTAPEAIVYRKFTSASDVWSFGVVMWEIMSYGERPYWNWSNQDVILVLERGYRLPPPMDCPEAIHRLMLECWQYERAQRPSFTAIVEAICKLTRHPECLLKIARPPPYSFCDTNPVTYRTIEEWLTAIKMDRYIDSFLGAGVSSMDQVAYLTINDLVSLGVTLAGHQKKIMTSIQTLRVHMNSFLV